MGTCDHFLHGACVAQIIARGEDACFVCRAPISPEGTSTRERLADIGVADVEIESLAGESWEPPESYFLVAPMCCKRVVAIDAGVFSDIEDRRMHWAPLVDPTSGETTGHWLCYRRGSSQLHAPVQPHFPSHLALSQNS